MVTANIVERQKPCIKARFLSHVFLVLSLGAAALPAGFAPAHARMGNSADLLGSEQADVNKIVLACVLGDAACVNSEGVFFRQFPRGTATLVWRGEATIENKDSIPGIGFGSLETFKKNGTFVDRLSWSGVRTRNPGGKLSASVRESVNISLGNGASKGCDTVIKTAADKDGQCKTLADTLEGAPVEFDYLIEIDPARFGDHTAVVVKPCKQVVAQCATTVLENEVTIDAHRSLGGYDLSSIGVKRYP